MLPLFVEKLLRYGSRLRDAAIPTMLKTKVRDKPLRGELRDLLKCARLFEQMSSPANNSEFGFAFHQRPGIAIHLKDGRVPAADDQQCRSLNEGDIWPCQIRPASAGYDRLHPLRPPGRRQEGCSRTVLAPNKPNRFSRA